MKRFVRFLVWFLGGSLSTLAIPVVLFAFVYLARGSKMEHPIAMVYGASVYFLVPAGLLASFIIGLVSLRWSVSGAEEPIQPPQTTTGSSAPDRV